MRIFSCPEQFYFISLFCSEYFVQDSLSKQSFGFNLAKSPSNLNFSTFFYINKAFLKSFWEIYSRSIAPPNLMVLCKKCLEYLI